MEDVADSGSLRARSCRDAWQAGQDGRRPARSRLGAAEEVNQYCSVMAGQQLDEVKYGPRAPASVAVPVSRRKHDVGHEPEYRRQPSPSGRHLRNRMWAWRTFASQALLTKIFGPLGTERVEAGRAGLLSGVGGIGDAQTAEWSATGFTQKTGHGVRMPLTCSAVVRDKARRATRRAIGAGSGIRRRGA